MAILLQVLAGGQLVAPQNITICGGIYPELSGRSVVVRFAGL
jgi:hypothetical protein